MAPAKTKAQLAREGVIPRGDATSFKPRKKELKMFLFEITTTQYSPITGDVILSLKRRPFKGVFDAFDFVKKVQGMPGKKIRVLHNPVPYLKAFKDVERHEEAERVNSLFS